MKKLLLVATLLWFSSPAQGTPLTWRFTGTTLSPSMYNNNSIVGLNFELRISLDTNLVGTTVMNLADVFFTGPHQGVVEINTVGVLPVNAFTNVQYFAPGGLVTGVQYNQPAFSGIQFPSSISSDSLHLTPIAPVAPGTIDTIQVMGPNGLGLRGEVATFAATLETNPVPEAGSTAAFLFIGLAAIRLVRRKPRRRSLFC
jgi:hypothetical protein